jgi:hypothetical protein
MFAARNMMFAGGFDADVAAFVVATGATDTTGISALVAYLKAESLWTSTRFFPFKSAQNAGSGSTVYGLGGLTANNYSLIASPTWGAGGVALNGSTQFGRLADCTSAATISVFCRANKTASPTSQTAYFGQYDTALNKRSVALWQDGTLAGDPLRMVRGSTGASSPTLLDSYTDGTTGIGSDTCFSAQWIAGGGRSLWANKTAVALTLDATSTAQTSRFDSDCDWTVGALMSNGSILIPSVMTATAFALVQADITTLQRETLTDLINAL